MLRSAALAIRASRVLLLAKYGRESSQRKVAGCDAIRRPIGEAEHVVSLYDLYFTQLFLWMIASITRLCWRMTQRVKCPCEETFLCRHTCASLRSRSMVGATLVVAR